MASKPIPYNQDFAPDMAQQVSQELHHLGTADRTGKQSKVKLSPGYPGHGRQMLPIKMVLKNRRLPSGRPRPTTVRPLAQPTLIDEYYRSLLPLGFFLSLGQRFFCQPSIFFSLRSNARRVGLWQLQPSSCKIRHTWAGWYFTPHSCSIRSATRTVVHNSVSYPSDLGSLLEFVLHASEIGRAEQGLSPGTPGFLKPPDSRLLNFFIPATHRLAVHSHLSRHLGLRYPAAQ